MSEKLLKNLEIAKETYDIYDDEAIHIDQNDNIVLNKGGIVANDTIASIAGGSIEKVLITNIVGETAAGLISDNEITESEANGDMSISYGMGNISHSSSTVSLGVKNQSGFLGYYLPPQTITNNTLLLSTSQTENSAANSKILSQWRAGDDICIIAGPTYPFCAKIKSVDKDNSKITLDRALPFTSIVKDSNEKPHDRSIIAIPPAKGFGSIRTYRPVCVGEVEFGFSSYTFGFDNIAAGTLSTAIGQSNTAVNTASFVTGRENTGSFASLVGGYRNTVTGGAGSAVGSNNTVTGDRAHAEGYYTTAEGSYSHAEGWGNSGENNLARGIGSHVEGRVTKTHAHSSHAEGYKSITGADTIDSSDLLHSAAHAEGYATKALTQGNHAEGINTVAGTHTPVYKQDSKGNYLDKDGNKLSDADQKDPSKWIILSYIGAGAHAEGQLTKSTGNASHSEGIYTVASGNSAHAEGQGNNNSDLANTASGTGSHAEGRVTKAIQSGAHAEGQYTLASGVGAHAEGKGDSDSARTTASGAGAHAEGHNTKALGDYSHSEGNNTTANAQSAHAEGVFTEATAEGAHAEGQGTADKYTRAEGIGSHAEGYQTLAKGQYSHAEGYKTTASGNYSHAEGGNTIAGNYSHAEGQNTRAVSSSHAEGVGTHSSREGQHVQGKYNFNYGTPTVPDAGDFAHIVGNGTNDKPSNAHTLDWFGNAWFAGTGTFTNVILEDAENGNVNVKSTLDNHSNRLTNLENAAFEQGGFSLVISAENADFASHSSLDIYACAQSGGTVVFDDQKRIYTLSWVGDTDNNTKKAVFSHIDNEATHIHYIDINENKLITRYSKEISASGDINLDSIIGTETDEPTANTIYGAKNYTDEEISKLNILSEETIATIVTQEAEKVKNELLGGDGLNEAYDTIKEISDWLSDDITGAAKIVNDIDTLQKEQVGKKSDNRAIVLTSQSNIATGAGSLVTGRYNGKQNILSQFVNLTIDNVIENRDYVGAEGTVSNVYQAQQLVNRLKDTNSFDVTFSGYGTTPCTRAYMENDKIVFILQYDDFYIPSPTSITAIYQECGAHADSATVLGEHNLALGSISHVEGACNETFAGAAHAEGHGTFARGYASHAQGRATEARGHSSFASGKGTFASGAQQSVFGTYNIIDNNDINGKPLAADKLDTDGKPAYQYPGDINNYNETKTQYAMIVGNGTNDKPSNAATLDWKGNAWFAGDVKVGASRKTLATIDQIPTKLSQLTNDNKSIERLWHNENLNASFGAQTLNIGANYNTKYSFIGIIPIFDKDGDKKLPLLLINAGATKGAFICGNNSSSHVSRIIDSFNPTTGDIVFGSGMKDGASDNGAAIPYIIFGVL